MPQAIADSTLARVWEGIPCLERGCLKLPVTALTGWGSPCTAGLLLPQSNVHSHNFSTHGSPSSRFHPLQRPPFNLDRYLDRLEATQASAAQL
ncbi:hypothetical protein DSO57_1002765 [Entomophthora muscae]|uniref:Uncharacterized protein n=1 Tax=Entomophthora muscae TaxID=34485 RepID=A0ACC2RNH0_9FUNG|nr:hypothetical protein DSO57_1002765 [Entomophthora muscae]